MKLWLSSETQSDVFELFRVASIRVEDCINDVISNKSYDMPLDSWDCIAILRDDQDFEEIIKYSPKKKDMDFRLGIEYEAFKKGDNASRETAIFNMLVRSLAILESKGLSCEGMNQLKYDVEKIGLDKKWSQLT